MDFVSKEDEELFRTTTPMTRMIKVSPFEYADKSQMKDYVLKEIESRYPDETENAEGDMSWQGVHGTGKETSKENIWHRQILRELYLEHIQVVPQESPSL